MSSLADMSHDISSSSSSSSIPSSMYMSKTPKESAHSSPAPPRVKQPPQVSKPELKALEDEIRAKRKQSIMVTCEQRAKSQYLKKYWEENPVPIPKPSDSLEAWEACDILQRKVMTMETKRILVDDFLETGLGIGLGVAGGFGWVDPEDQDFANFILQPEIKNKYLQPEMEEIAIDLSDSLVPRPEIRLCVKLFKAWKEFKMIKQYYKENSQNTEKLEAVSEQPEVQFPVSRKNTNPPPRRKKD
jgi:hypothetical protein